MNTLRAKKFLIVCEVFFHFSFSEELGYFAHGKSSFLFFVKKCYLFDLQKYKNFFFYMIHTGKTNNEQNRI